MDKNTVKTEQELEVERKHKRALKIGTWSAIFLIIFIVIVSFFFIGHNPKTSVLSYSGAQCPIPAVDTTKLVATNYPDCPIPEKKSFFSAAAAILGWNNESDVAPAGGGYINSGGTIGGGSIGGGDISAQCTRVNVLTQKIHSTTGENHVDYVYTLFCDRGISTLGASDDIASSTKPIYSGGSVGGGTFGGGNIASGGYIPSGGTI